MKDYNILCNYLKRYSIMPFPIMGKQKFICSEASFGLSVLRVQLHKTSVI